VCTSFKKLSCAFSCATSARILEALVTTRSLNSYKDSKVIFNNLSSGGP
jgi:hypothetical protein